MGGPFSFSEAACLLMVISALSTAVKSSSPATSRHCLDPLMGNSLRTSVDVTPLLQIGYKGQF